MKIGEYQALKLKEIKKVYPDFEIMIMHNEKEKSELATQVEVLTDKRFSFGQFGQGDGYLVNNFNKLLILLPEASLKSTHLFDLISIDNNLNRDKCEFITKKSLSDIDYKLRERPLGNIDLDGDNYLLFKKAPQCYGDKTKIFIIKEKTLVAARPENNDSSRTNKIK